MVQGKHNINKRYWTQLFPQVKSELLALQYTSNVAFYFSNLHDRSPSTSQHPAYTAPNALASQTLEAQRINSATASVRYLASIY